MIYCTSTCTAFAIVDGRCAPAIHHGSDECSSDIGVMIERREIKLVVDSAWSFADESAAIRDTYPTFNRARS
jgi:hypothetical protein